ncbi:MAG: nucleotidyltransferase domain-containing protein [Candidatus Nanohaloarchaea archaeon]|nr:nucleotidyltransferase domain-containing protein [Candidatus Nanohaloarchaea archaeon]
MEEKLEDAVKKLKKFDSVHSLLLFGSHAKGEADEQSDIDVCVVSQPEVEIDLDERLRMERDLDRDIDLSILSELPLNLRHRVLVGGEILYTEDKLYIFQLLKQINLELPKYEKFREEYHEKTMEEVKT